MRWAACEGPSSHLRSSCTVSYMLSSFDAGTIADYYAFLQRRPNGHGLSLNIPDRENIRGRC